MFVNQNLNTLLFYADLRSIAAFACSATLAGGNTEMFIKLGSGTRCAKSGHANKTTMIAKPAVPALLQASFNRYTRAPNQVRSGDKNDPERQTAPCMAWTQLRH